MNDWRTLKRMLKSLGDVARLTIVYHLAHEEQDVTVHTLTDLLHLSQPLVSWHLSRLRRAGLVETRRVGRQVYCTLNREQFQHCLRVLEGLIDPSIRVETLPRGEELLDIDPAMES